MQDLKKKGYLELYRELIFAYEDMLSIENRLPWQLHIIHFRLQLVLCGKVHKLRKAIQNCRMTELSREDKRKLIELFKEFENNQTPEIFGWTVDRKIRWFIAGLVAVFVAWTLPSSILSKIDMNLLLDLPKNAFSPVDIFKLVLSSLGQPITDYSFLFVGLVTGMVRNFLFFVPDQFLRLYIRCYDRVSSLENFYDAIRKVNGLESIQGGLSRSLPSSLERLEFDAFKNLPTSPPSVFPQSDMWFFLFSSIFFSAISIPSMFLALVVLLYGNGTLDELKTLALVAVLLVYAIWFGYCGVFSVLGVIKRREFIRALIVSASRGIYSRKFSLTKNS